MKRDHLDMPELRAAFAPMPDSFHRRIVTALGEEQKLMKVRSKMTIVLAVALIAVLALGVTAFAIARSAILEHYFTDDEPTPEVQALLQTESVCAQEHGVRLELTESLYDPQARTVYLTVRVQALTENGALVALAEPAFGEGVAATSDRFYLASPMGGGMTMLGGECEGERLHTDNEYVYSYTFAQEPPEQVLLTLTAGVYDSVNAPIWAGPEGDDALYRHYYENRLTALSGSAAKGNTVDFSSYANWEKQELRTAGKTLDQAFEAAVTNGFVTKRGEVTLTTPLTLKGAAGEQKADIMTAVAGESDLTTEVVDYTYYADKRELTMYLRTQSSTDEPRAWGIESFRANDETLIMDDPAYASYEDGWDRGPLYGYTQLLGEGALGRYPLERERLYRVRMYLPEGTQPGDALTLRMHALSAIPATEGENLVTVNPYASVYDGRALSERKTDEIARVMQMYVENGAATSLREEVFEWTFAVPQEGDAHYLTCQKAEFDEYTVVIRQNGAGMLRGDLRFEVYLKRAMQEEASNERADTFVNADTHDPLYRWYVICDASGTQLAHDGANFGSYRNGLGEDYFAYSYKLSPEILTQDSIFIAPCTDADTINAEHVLWDERVEIALR